MIENPMTRILILILIFVASCGTSPHRPDTQGRPVLDLARHATSPNPNAGLSSESNLTGLVRVPVAGSGKFDVAARTAQLERFPCSRCHDRPLAQVRQSAAAAGKKAAHWEINLKHAPATILACDSCHQTNTNTDSLRTLRGDPVEFDHSYQLCAQCHSRQFNDWTGGAHGKRLGGWAPPRVIQNCSGCHDPHSPHMKSRWPSVSAPTKSGATTHE